MNIVVTVNKETLVKRKLVGMVRGGLVYFQVDGLVGESNPSSKVGSIYMDSITGRFHSNGAALLEKMLDASPGATPIYEGDSVTLQF